MVRRLWFVGFQTSSIAPGPYVAVPAAHPLVGRTGDFSFPSDHSTAAAAIATDLVVAVRWTLRRWVGWAASVMAVLLGFSGVRRSPRPCDVAGGFVLGAVFAWVFAPVTARLLRPLVRLITTGALAVLATARQPHTRTNALDS